MNKTTEYFEKNSYVILSGALTKNQCEELVRYMFKLHEEGKLVKDDQCPLSDAVYGDPVFDRILENFALPIGQSIGRKLLPTYTYARIYRNGEILKRHTDRPSCEISATLTLGFDADAVWPIFFNEIKEIPVSLEIGEMAVYKGCDIVHWRPAFKGNWHIQVFFHYVDADGPYKDFMYDGRSKLGTLKDQNIASNQKINDVQENKSKIITDKTSITKPIFDVVGIPAHKEIFPGYFCIDSTYFPELKFTNAECDKIINLTKINYPVNASIGGSHENSAINKKIRSAEIYNVDYNSDNKWIFEKIANIVAVANHLYFDYDLLGITHSIQLIEYSADSPIKGHYDWHVDVGNGNPVYRKISVTAQLSDPSQYEGCELVINNHAHEVIGTKERGSVHLFPSYMLHKVSPITNGVRYALVIWVHGSNKFR